MPLDDLANEGGSLTMADHADIADWIKDIAWAAWACLVATECELVEEIAMVGPRGDAWWCLWRRNVDGRLMVECLKDSERTSVVDTVAMARAHVEITLF